MLAPDLMREKRYQLLTFAHSISRLLLLSPSWDTCFFFKSFYTDYCVFVRLTFVTFQDDDAPIHIAAYYGCQNVVKILLDHGLDINITGEVGLILSSTCCCLISHPLLVGEWHGITLVGSHGPLRSGAFARETGSTFAMQE